MEMTYHCKVQRKNRVQHIIDEIGLGQVVRQRFNRSIEDALAGKAGTYTCITDTGITLIKTEDKQRIITMYVTTYAELVSMYNGSKNIPAFLRRRVDRNQSFYIKDGKTIWR